MENIFRGENIIEFIRSFPTDEKCKEVVAAEKWKDGYTCSHCGHKKYVKVKKDFGRECTRCRYVESATANTLFHKVKFGLQKAFCIVFEMTCTTKGLSSTQAAKRYGITQKTSWMFMHKVRLSMGSSAKHPMEGCVYVDEFVVGGKETGKQGRSYDTKKDKVVLAIEVSPEGGVKRGYAKVIKDYSAKSIRPLFEAHIGSEAKVFTDKWTAYTKLSKEYDITQEKSEPGKNFNQIHTIIHQIKSGLRTIQTHTKGHLQKYLDEYCFRLNRSIFKETIFDGLVKRMVAHEKSGWNKIVLAK